MASPAKQWDGLDVDDNLVIVDEVGESSDTNSGGQDAGGGSDSDIQFVVEIVRGAGASDKPKARKRRLKEEHEDRGLTTDANEGKSVITTKRRKLNDDLVGDKNEEVIVVRDPSESPDFDDTEVDYLYTSMDRIHTSMSPVHTPKNKPALNKTIWEQIDAYRRKFPKKFAHFDLQITNHYINNIQNDCTFVWKMNIRQRILTAIRECYQLAKLYVVGSTINGCGSFNADMDLCCEVPAFGVPDGDRNFAVKALAKIQNVLRKNKRSIGMSTCLLIRAKVPILRLQFKGPYKDLEVDLNVNNFAGVYNSYLLHYYSRIDDRFPAICLLVKQWAKRNGIGEAMHGMLNSYSIILMVIHFLQTAIDPPILPNLQMCYPELFNENRPLDRCALFQNLEMRYADPKLIKYTVGELLIAFFDYYANFDFKNWAISISGACVFPRSHLCKSTRRFKIFIEEPFDKNNTARCVTSDINFQIIKGTIENARSWFLGKRRPDINHIGVIHKRPFDRPVNCF